MGNGPLAGFKWALVPVTEILHTTPAPCKSCKSPGTSHLTCQKDTGTQPCTMQR